MKVIFLAVLRRFESGQSYDFGDDLKFIFSTLNLRTLIYLTCGHHDRELFQTAEKQNLHWQKEDFHFLILFFDVVSFPLLFHQWSKPPVPHPQWVTHAVGASASSTERFILYYFEALLKTVHDGQRQLLRYHGKEEHKRNYECLNVDFDYFLNEKNEENRKKVHNGQRQLLWCHEKEEYKRNNEIMNVKMLTYGYFERTTISSLKTNK